MIENNSKEKPIVFIGSMNAMPMMYAIELKARGYNVFYVVDVQATDVLSRPEFHFPEINYPYPEWIIEFPLRSQLAVALFPRLFLALLTRRLKKINAFLPSALIVTSGFHHSFIKYFPRSSKAVALSYGADLDVWANRAGIDSLVKNLSKRSVFKFLPRWVAKLLISKIVDNQWDNLNRASSLIYFARGFNEAGDKVLSEFKGKDILARHDVSFLPMKGIVKKNHFCTNNKLVLISPVRFLFETFPDGNTGYNKGNDKIIEGIAEFKKHNIPFEMHFVEKGEDVAVAKRMVKELGLEGDVIWHSEMPFSDLLRLYEMADICFDQVGNHWVGAVGVYALYLGIPLIANSENLVKAGIIQNPNLICNASTAYEVCQQLLRLSDEKYYASLSCRLQGFAQQFFGPEKIIHKIIEMI